MSELVRLKGVEAVEESTYATDAGPSASDGVQVEENIWTDIETGYLNENLREEAAGEGLGRFVAGEPTGRFINFDLTFPLKGAGSAYSAEGDLEFNPILKACGLSVSVNGGAGSESITYTPQSSGHSSATIYLYTASTEFQCVGCRGDLTISFMPGQFVMATASMSGLLQTDPSDASLPDITYDNSDVSPPTVKSAGFTMNSFDPSDFESFEFQLQNDLPERPRGNASDGHAGYQITDWNPQFQATIDRPNLSSFDPWSLRDNNTTFSWDIGTIGSTQYNQIDLSGPAGRIIDLPQASSDGFAMLDMTVRAQNSAISTPDDAFSLTFS